MVGLRWINRGGRSTGLVALLAAVVYAMHREMHVPNGRKVQLGAPGDRAKDHVKTTMAQMAAERVDRDLRRARMDTRDKENPEDDEIDEPRRVLSTEVAAAVEIGERILQQPSQRRGSSHCSLMSPLMETPGQHEEDEGDREGEDNCLPCGTLDDQDNEATDSAEKDQKTQDDEHLQNNSLSDQENKATDSDKDRQQSAHDLQVGKTIATSRAMSVDGSDGSDEPGANVETSVNADQM